MWDSIFSALSGPLLAKLALLAILIAAFLFLRMKDTEGTMVGYAALAFLLCLRDIVFSIFPNVALYNASDIALFGALLYLGQKPFRLGWAFWLPLSLAVAGCILLIFEAFGIALAILPDLVRLVALAPVVAAALLPLMLRAEADTPVRILMLRAWLPLSIASILYIGAGALLGTASPVFLVFLTPAFYCMLFVVVLLFVDIIQGQLISAVDYYEESIDSLYDLLLSTGTAMRSETFLQDVVDNMIKTVVERTGADGGVLLLADEFDETVSVRALYGSYAPPFKLPENLPKSADRVESFVRHARFKLGEGILGEVARTGKNVFVPQASANSPLPDNGDDAWLKASGFIASPLILRDRIIGAVSVVKSGEGTFSERDFDRCKLLANFGSIAVANSFSFLEAAERSDIEREADIAAGIQKNLIIKELPEVGGIELGAYSSSARGVCSDYYDIIQTKSDKALLVVGDAAGKGVAAGVVLVMMRSILHLITASTKDAATLLQWVNRGITGKVDSDHYATLCLAAVDAGSGMAEISNAGHQPAIVCRASDGALEAVESKSVPIGVERRTAYTSTNVALANGDVLVLYTDGIVETVNAQGKQYGRKNLGVVIQRSRGLDPSAIANAVRDDVEQFAGHSLPHDDRTVLVMKRKKA